VSRVGKWDRFDSEWSAILAREGVKSMHMTDFASSKKQFKSWRGQSERRRKFISDLTDCIKRNTNKGFATSVYVSDYNEVDAEYTLKKAVEAASTSWMIAAFDGSWHPSRLLPAEDASLRTNSQKAIFVETLVSTNYLPDRIK
jgi:hypothetical protein